MSEIPLKNHVEIREGSTHSVKIDKELVAAFIDLFSQIADPETITIQIGRRTWKIKTK